MLIGLLLLLGGLFLMYWGYTQLAGTTSEGVGTAAIPPADTSPDVQVA